MVVDTSALVAIIRNEPERDALMERLAETPAPFIAAVTWMETRMVVLSRSAITASLPFATSWQQLDFR